MLIQDCGLHAYVVIQFYPWKYVFKNLLPYITIPQKQRETKFKPSIKLNPNIYIWVSGKCRGIFISDYSVHLQQSHR